MDPHSLHSSRREKILQAAFTAAVLKELWRRGEYEVDVLHSDIDASGYDLVLCGPFGERHIQLKSSKLGGRSRAWAVNAKISDKPSGCVVVLLIDPDTLVEKEYLWYGQSVGQPCEDLRLLKPAKHTKADSTGTKARRRDSFQLPRSAFKRLKTVVELVDALMLATASKVD